MKTLHLKMIAFVFIYMSSFGQTSVDENIPDRIILNLTENPFNSIAVTWRTVAAVDSPVVEYSTATSGLSFAKECQTIAADKQNYTFDDSINVYHYSAVLTGLAPNELYAYRVGCKSGWSEWNQFKTADDKPAPFEFVYFGDPQNNIKNYCSRIFRSAFQASPNAAFWLFAGDIVTEPKDHLWSELFYAGNFVFRMIPSVLAAGNHDHTRAYVNNKKVSSEFIHPIWNAHFTLPENGINGLEELSYYTDYQGVRVIILESQTKLDEQAIWLEDALSSNSNLWTIVAFHHPVFSTGRDRKETKTQNAFMHIFDKYNVDLVLQGHDHVYGRTYKLFNNKIVDDSVQGTVYVVSVSGSKFYPVKKVNEELMVKMGGNIQLFQTVHIDGNKLTFKAITATGELFDSFELNKN